MYLKKQEQSMPSAESGSVKSAMRVLDLFEYLRRWNAAQTHTQIAAQLAIPKSSLTQLLKTLVNRGYLNYDPVSKGYFLGPAVVALGQRSAETRDLVEVAANVLAETARTTNETCALNVLKGDHSEVMATASGTHRLHYLMRVGDMAPLYATSGGKALLAHLPEEMRQDYLSRVRFEAITPQTIGSVAALETEIAEIKRTGIAFVTEEFTPGIAGMALPILSRSGFPLAAVNIALPVARYDAQLKQRCLTALEAAVAMIRQRAGLA
jgi:DNA-binding IclR family transcriptional regulator